MKSPLTRRQWTVAVAAALPAAAQNPPASEPSELDKARQMLKANASRLAACKLPQETEPSFIFKV